MPLFLCRFHYLCIKCFFMIKQILYFSLLTSFVFCSCVTRKNKAENVIVNSAEASFAVVGNKVAMDTNITANSQNNSWYSTRATITLSSSNDEISAFIVNRRDSVLYVNINKFGIELARAVFTPDTISIVNRFEKTYYKGDYSIIYKLYGFSLSYNMVQAIVLGEPFRDFKPVSKSVTQTDSTFIISTPRSVDVFSKTAINQMLVLDKKEHVIVSNWVKDIATQQVVTISYAKYEQIETFRFPSNYTIELPTQSIQIVTKSSKVNVPGPTSLMIPQKYTLMFP